MRGEPKFNDKTNITISLDGQVGKDIKQIAKKQGLSTNSIVNKILKDYVMFGKYFQEHNPIIIAPEIFSFLLQEVDEETWLRSWEIALEKVTVQVFAMHNLEPTLENLLKYLLADIGSRVGIFTKFTCHENDAGYKLIIIHPYDEKWSRVLGSAFTKMFVKSFGVKVNSQTEPNSLKMEIIAK